MYDVSAHGVDERMINYIIIINENSWNKKIIKKTEGGWGGGGTNKRTAQTRKKNFQDVAARYLPGKRKQILNKLPFLSKKKKKKGGGGGGSSPVFLWE